MYQHSCTCMHVNKFQETLRIPPSPSSPLSPHIPPPSPPHHLSMQASHLYECGFNHGALLVAGLFLSEEDEAISSPAADYLSRFSEHSPWRNKAVSHYVELLEHSDQEVRVGACLALGQLQVRLRYRAYYIQLIYIHVHFFLTSKELYSCSATFTQYHASFTLSCLHGHCNCHNHYTMS